MKFTRLPLFLVALLSTILISCTGQPKAVQNLGKTNPTWCSDATMYELNTRQFTPEGTFAAAQAHLPRLKELGVKVIWFMPIQPIGVLERKGELGSYYAISDYKGINPEFGTIDDFRNFVEASHKLGIKVILDWVAHHTSPDAIWIKNQSWYERDSLGKIIAPYDWTDVAKLNYADKDMRLAMIDAMKYWLTDAKIDGFRCDVAGEVPTDFWEAAVTELLVVNPDLFMLAEAEKADLMNSAFDAYYAWHLHHVMNSVAQGKQNADSLRHYFANQEKKIPAGIPLNFTSNHDENSWNGTEFERMGDAAEAMAAFTYVIPGMPLIYNGQEAGFNRRLEFFVKDSIDWNFPSKYNELYTSLSKLRRDNPALHTGQGNMQDIKSSAPDRIFSIVRTHEKNTVMAIFNMSAAEVSATFDCKKCEGSYTCFATGSEFAMHNSANVTLGPWEYRILIKK